jgi:hemoglobin/transferrin/lactoferrin receptor protein
MQDSVTVLPPVRVEGARVDQAARTTNSQTKLTRGQLVRFLPSTPAEAMLAAPGVDIVRTGGWATQVSLRGLTGERVLVMVDGVRMNTGRGHGAQSSLVSIDRLDEVEVTPGSGGAAYGSDALAGVVNLVTHRPLFAAKPSLTTSWIARGSEPGDEGSLSGRVAYRSAHLGAELQGGLSRRWAFVTPEGPLFNSGDHEGDWAGRIAARSSWIGADYEHTRHDAMDVGLPAFNNAAGSTATYPLQRRDADRLELTGPGAPERISWRVLASNQTYRSDFDEVTVDSSFIRNHFVATTTTNAADQVHTTSRGVLPELRLFANGALRFGGEYRRDDSHGPRTTDVTTRTAAGLVTNQSTGSGESVPPAFREVWSGWTSGAVERWAVRLEGGARFDHVRTYADTATVSGAPALDLHDRRWSLDGGVARRFGVIEPHVHVASGFRVANLDERFFNDEVHAGMRVFGNPLLRPEHSTTVDVGLRADGAHGALTVSVYRSDVVDLISLRYMGQLYLVPRFMYDNIERARLEGIEMTGRTSVRGVGLSMQATLPRGRDLVTGKALTDVGSARVTGEMALGLPRFVPQGRAALRVRWLGAVTSTQEGEAETTLLRRPAAVIVSAEAGVSLHGSRVTFAVQNLTNHSYMEPMSFLAEAGRAYALSIRRDFDLPLSHR